MIKVFLQVLGWIVSHTPEPLLNASCIALGRLTLVFSRRRRRVVLSNLHHAFPERSPDWHWQIARECSRRFFETMLLSLATPYFTESRIRRSVTSSAELDAWFRTQHENPKPLVMVAPHMAYWESLCWVSLFISVPMPELGVIFRPLNNAAADAWIKKTRERFGMRLLSRKTGLQEAFKLLKRNAIAGVLFDQNAGMQGALTTLFGRVCSTSELAGLLCEKHKTRLGVYFARRAGFWRIHFELTPIAYDGTAAGATIALNQWLEQALTADDNVCSSWLWTHDRWRNQDVPQRRFRLEAKRNLLHDECVRRTWSELPKKTRIWIRMPNWLGDVVMALPLLRALRTSRPDAEITLIAKPSLRPLLEHCGLADHVEPLPERGGGYFLHFWRLRQKYPDVYALFTHSTRGDLEAWLTRCPQRFGVVRSGKRRPLLTHRYEMPAGFDEAEHHQLETWEAFFRNFGLSGEVDRSPISLRKTPEQTPSVHVSDPVHPVIGFIAGSENNPEKRWPVEHWRTLIVALSAEYPYATFVLLGTANDQPITAAIGDGLGARLVDLAGKTDLPAYMNQLRQCTVLVSNDTGGMHLANALGVPVVALFGPTNPVRTSPVYSSPFQVVQPQGCPRTGGGNLAKLQPEEVVPAVRRFLPKN
ncbi:hypothetical protein DB347_18555 [Opitutaceae bacterium EW11]|nr:hypothetical protein DB347_18555 [Opitutaceae bacterium EW11]